jgi:hypothetical protein
MAGKFTLDAKGKAAIGNIAKNHPGIKAVVRAVAADVLARAPGAHVAEYTTDRFVNAIQVPADEQAKHGTATKAFGSTGRVIS